jgi:hypothetical protein
MDAFDGMDPAQLVELARQDPSAAREAVYARLKSRAAGNPVLEALMACTMRPPEPDDRDARRTSGRAQRIRDRILEMREELAELHQRNADLADALGACPSCWGKSRSCGECSGNGAPGWRAQDKTLFEELIAPALGRDVRAPGEVHGNGTQPEEKRDDIPG